MLALFVIILAIVAIMGWMRASAWKQALLEANRNARAAAVRAQEFCANRE